MLLMTSPTSLRLDAFLPYRLSFTSNLVSNTIASAYETLFGLKISEWRLIAVIAERQSATQQRIGEVTHMDKMTVSRAAATLVARSFLARRPNPDDKRSHLLVLTAPGAGLYAEIAPKALELERRLFDGFTPAERQTLIDLLGRIDRVAQDRGDLEKGLADQRL